MLNPNSKELQALREFVGNRPIKGGLPFAFFDDEIWYTGADSSELIRKAESGDALALEQLANYTLQLCHALELLAQRNESFVKSVASTFSAWPVSLSLNSVSIGRARMVLESLDVGGANALTPAYPGKRTDPSNLWTRYAQNAFICLSRNQRDVPALLVECAQTAKAKFNSPLQEFQTTHEATWYDVGDKVIVIADWQRLCVELPQKLTRESVPQFMELAKYAIRQFWWEDRKAFDDVKAKAAGLVHTKTDGQYIDRALEKIEQALFGLAHQ